MTCDVGRPCKRCISRHIGHLCHDEPTSHAVKHESASPPQEKINTSTPVISYSPVQATQFQNYIPPKKKPRLPASIGNSNVNLINPTLAPMTAPSPSFTQSDFGNGSFDTTLNPDIFDVNFPYLQSSFSFASDMLSSEFGAMGDFLNLIDDVDSSAAALREPPQVQPQPLLLQQQPHQPPHPPATSIKTTEQKPQPQIAPASNPLQSTDGSTGHERINSNDANVSVEQARVTEAAKERFYMLASDPLELSAEERLKQVINAKVEAGLLRPYNYVKGYARLQKYMEANMSLASRQRVLRPLSIFRPAFRAVAQSLTDVDLVIVEESFERLLLDYDRNFTSMAIPACVWRRTGEIYRGNKEFAALVNVSLDQLRDVRDQEQMCNVLMNRDELQFMNLWRKKVLSIIGKNMGALPLTKDKKRF